MAKWNRSKTQLVCRSLSDDLGKLKTRPLTDLALILNTTDDNRFDRIQPRNNTVYALSDIERLTVVVITITTKQNLRLDLTKTIERTVGTKIG